MSDSLNVLYVCSEVAPLAKTGGLGDVSNALPRALCKLGHDVRVAIPCYGSIKDSWKGEAVGPAVAEYLNPRAEGVLRMGKLPNNGVPLYLVQNDFYFDRDYLYGYPGTEYDDNLDRFAFFCAAVLDGVKRTGWRPDVVHCHDWHTALIPAYLRLKYSHDDFYAKTPSLLTIHNLIYQGVYPSWRMPAIGLPWDVFHAECFEFYGDINIMKGGFAFATKINAVSRRYAAEIQSGEQGAGLEGFLRTRSADLSGILNGADYDEWNPSTDPHTVAQYSDTDISGKNTCREALLKWAGLKDGSVPVIGVVSRIVWQKGFDVVVEAIHDMMKLDIRLVILGAGDPLYEDALLDAAEMYPDKLRLELKYDDILAHQIEAGADFFLMPSHFEPSGLSQLYSLKYGTVPIVRRTGGLADTVVDATKANIAKGDATGIVFDAATAPALVEAVKRAVALFKDHNAYRCVQQAGMAQDFSWDRASKSYVNLYREAMRKMQWT